MNNEIEQHVKFAIDREWWKIQLSLICIQQGRKYHMGTVASPLPHNLFSMVLTRVLFDRSCSPSVAAFSADLSREIEYLKSRRTQL